MANLSNCPSCGGPLKFSGTRDFVICEFCGMKVVVTEDSEKPGDQIVEAALSESEQLNQLFSVGTQPEPEEIKFNFGQPVSEPVETSSPQPQRIPDIVPPPYNPVSTPASSSVSSDAWKKWLIVGAIVLVVLCVLCVCGVGALLMANGGSVNY